MANYKPRQNSKNNIDLANYKTKLNISNDGKF